MTEKIATIEHRTPNTEPQNYPLISIVIPAYNCEKYIAKCLDSIINQDITARNYEVFITDDGSKDSTGTICDEYASKYPFIHVTHTDNHGPGHARNTAISQCSGKYITFCDSDDFISPQYISLLTRAIELHNDADMFIFKYFHDLPNGKWPLYDVSAMNESNWQAYSSSEEVLMKVFGDVSIGGYPWNKVIRREFVENTPFNNNLAVMEDHWWLVNLLTKYRNMHIYSSEYRIYCYVLHVNSTSGDSRSIYTKDGMSWFVISLEEELKLENLSPRAAEQIQALIYYWSTNNMYRMGKLMNDDVRKKITSYLKGYAWKYYTKSVQPISWKLRALARHIAIFLHIFKYK